MKLKFEKCKNYRESIFVGFSGGFTCLMVCPIIALLFLVFSIVLPIAGLFGFIFKEVNKERVE